MALWRMVLKCLSNARLSFEITNWAKFMSVTEGCLAKMVTKSR